MLEPLSINELARVNQVAREQKTKEFNNRFCSKGHSLATYGRRKRNGKPYCQACSSLQWKNYCIKNAEKSKIAKRKYKLKVKYNITEQDVSDKLLNQDYKCAICKTDDWGKKGYHIDHDHKTGKFRGILCASCNCALGHFQDSRQILTSALVYLEREGGCLQV